MEKKTYRPRIKVQMQSEEREVFFGSGIAELLRRIDESGSMRKASIDMGMSYSKCWKIIRRAEKCVGFSFLDGTVGGASGGGSKLTPEGEEFLKKYTLMKEEIDRKAEKIFEKYFPGE